MMRIRERERNEWCRKSGLRGRWWEYQAIDGRRIVGRYDNLVDARRANPSALPGDGIDVHLWDKMTVRMQELGQL